MSAEVLWLSRSAVLRRFSLPRRQLTHLVTSGRIRTLKFGAAMQAGRRFYCPDIEQALLDLAEGRELSKPGRGVAHRAPAGAAAAD